MRYPGFIGGTAVAQSPIFQGERTVNFYLERASSPGAATASMLLPVPGVEVWATHATAATVRGLWAESGRCFAVLGTTFAEVGSNKTLTDLPTGSPTTLSMDTGQDPVSICSNGDGGQELLVTSGGTIYLYGIPPGGVVTAKTVGFKLDGAPLDWTATMAGMLDGFFLALDTSTSTFYISEPLDGTKWDATQCLQRSGQPDRWVSLIVVGREIWLLGALTSDVLYNSGASPFPFTFHSSGTIPYGCLAPWSAVAVPGGICWLASSRHGGARVVLAAGLTPRVISTPAVDAALDGYATVTDAVAASYESQGHAFYVLTFPTAEATWVYDLTTDTWAERGRWDPDDARYLAWRPLAHAFAFGVHLFGDRVGGTIYVQSNAYVGDVAGGTIRRLRRAPAIVDEHRRVGYDAFELALEPGLGTVSGEGMTPEVVLNYSNDAGKTWTTAGQRSAGSGALGQYRKRVRWTRLGSSRQRMFEVVMSDPIPWRIVEAILQVRPSKAP